MRKLSFDIEDRMKSIGWYQILGGSYGLCWIFYLLLHVIPMSVPGILLLLLSILIFSFGIYSGNLLRNGDIRGLTLSTWNQLLQVLQIGIGPFVFEYFSGIRLAIGFEWLEKFSPDATLSLSGLTLQYRPENGSLLSFWINIIPIMVIYSIDKIEKDIEERKQIAETSVKLANEEKALNKESTNASQTL